MLGVIYYTRSPATSMWSKSDRTLSRVAPGRRTMATSSSGSLVEFGQKHVTKGLGRVADGIMSKGQGSYVTFEGGKQMLDFTCGIAVTGLGQHFCGCGGGRKLIFRFRWCWLNIGHCHPKVSEAAAKQCMELVHAQCSIAFHGPYLRLIEKLIPIMPHPSLNSFFFWNSGSEAVEAAIKMSRIVTGKQNIIAMQGRVLAIPLMCKVLTGFKLGGYHGRTFGAMAVTKSKTIYSEGVAPLMVGRHSYQTQAK